MPVRLQMAILIRYPDWLCTYASRGADVRWYSSEIFNKKLEQLGIPHYPFVKALEVNTENMEEVFPARKNYTDPAQKLNFDLVEIFAKRSEEYYEDLQDIYAEFPFDVVIADCMFSAIPLYQASK